MTILGMSIGSWILILIIVVWAVLAIKSYFFGGLKSKKKGLQVGNCCDTSDADACACGKCDGCDEQAVRQNSAMPTFKEVQ